MRSRLPRFWTLTLAFGLSALATPAGVVAGTLRVCASGCTYSRVQTAIDAAKPGDTILLRAGETFVDNIVLPAKATPSTGPAFVLIRSDAADDQLPAAGTRLVPEGKPGANTPRSRLPRLLGNGGTYKNTPVIRTAAGAHHYRFQFLEIDGAANVGYGTLVKVGDNDYQTTLSAVPYDIVFDRVYVHGHRYKGQKRGFELNGRNTSVMNSYVSDIKSYGFDSQAINGVNGPGPFQIVNNYLEGAAENIMFGGADPKITNLVPSNIELRRNHITKPVAWRSPILAPPGSAAAVTSTARGVLSAARHYFKVVAVMATNGSTVRSLPSAETSIALPSGTTAVALSWSSVAGADRYRIYRGTAAGGQSVYLETASASTSFTYTGDGEVSGTPPTKAPLWSVKNLIELKNAQDVLIDGNLIEHNWTGAGDQAGYAIVLRSDDGGKAPWTVVQRVTISNNRVQRVPGGLNLVGIDGGTVVRANRITIFNNIWHDLDPSIWGGVARFAVVNGVHEVTIDHNTIDSTASAVVWGTGTPSQKFIYRNNMSRHGKYGVKGDSAATGNATLAEFFPGALFTRNVLAGGPSSSYPTGNYFPSVSTWEAGFADFANGDYRLDSGSPYRNAGTDGKDLGADAGAVAAAYAGSSASPAPSPAPDDGSTAPPPTDGSSTANQFPIADPGGPYTGSRGQTLVFDGSGSRDPDGSLTSSVWRFGADIVLLARDVPSTQIHGRWSKVSASTAAAGVELLNPNQGDSRQETALATPANYVELTFQAAAGVPYRLWLRMRAENNAYANDSVHVQFSGSVDASGMPQFRIGSTDSAAVVLQDGSSGSLNGRGWTDHAYGSVAAPIYFATAGIQRIRIQQREDGAAFDQIVLSAGQYYDQPPGGASGDTTIVPATLGSATGATVSHSYRFDGVYPVTLEVRDGAGARATRRTLAGVGRSLTGARADAVLTASDVAAGRIVGNWRVTADASAASGLVLHNPNNGAAKISPALASPRDYVELTFHAAAGVPYHLWARLRAESNSTGNDSVHVQFSGSVDASGRAVWRIGTSSSAELIAEAGPGAGIDGWGWTDAGWGTLAGEVYFAASGPQTLRIQSREDGAVLDQIVLSPSGYLRWAPGSAKRDGTIVPSTLPLP